MDRADVLAKAITFEDLGVAAYNGAGKYLRDGGLLTHRGQDRLRRGAPRLGHPRPHPERHAVRRHGRRRRQRLDGIEEVVEGNALDRALEPAAVLSRAGAFISNTITATNVG